jgi:hypothetical protein
VGLRRFAREHGLRYTQLHYWLYGTRRSGDGTAAVSNPDAGPAFREYIVPRASAGDWAAEIALPDGTSLRVSRGADPAWAGVLLDQLRRPCSL